jgi:hypothetical protein
MYDRLATATPDYSASSLSVSPHKILIEEGSYNQQVNKADDRSVIAVVTIGSSVEYLVRLLWEYINATDDAAIHDMYFDPAKAHGLARTFKWPHPTDGHIYVARFTGPLIRSRDARVVGRASYDELRLLIEGYVS